MYKMDAIMNLKSQILKEEQTDILKSDEYSKWN
jgi:hypothetical protein